MKTEIKPGCLVYVKRVIEPRLAPRLLYKTGEAIERRLPGDIDEYLYFLGPFWIVIIPGSGGNWDDKQDHCAFAECDLVPLNDPTADVSETQELEVQT